MIKTDFLKWFPQGRLQSNPNAKEDEVAIPISSNQWLLFKKSITVAKCLKTFKSYSSSIVIYSIMKRKRLGLGWK